MLETLKTPFFIRSGFLGDIGIGVSKIKPDLKRFLEREDER